MTGIVAAWHLAGAPADPVLLRAMGRRAGLDVQPWTGGAVGIGASLVDPALPGRQPARVGPHGVVLAFDGRLDEREALRAAGDLPVDAAAPDAELVLAAYHAWGDRFVERLEGEFALVLHDPRTARLLLARDAVGTRPLQYVRTGRWLLAASEMKSFLAHPEFSPRPDVAHLAEFLVRAEPARDGGMTFLEGVHAVAPGERVEVTPERVVRRRFWDFAGETIRCGSTAAYRDAFAAHFDRAVSRRMRGIRPVAVSVSGGVDSSAVYCTARALGAADPALASVEGLTETVPGDPRADEIGYVEEMERQYGQPIHRLPGAGLGTLESWQRQVWHSEVPQLHPFATATEHRLRFAAGLGADVLLGGEWADAMVFEQAYLVDLVRRGAWRTAASHLAEIPAWFGDADPGQFRAQFLRDLARFHLPAAAIASYRRLRRVGIDPMLANAPALRGAGGRIGRDPRPGVELPSLHARALYGRIRSRRTALDLQAMAKYAAGGGVRFGLPFMDRDLLGFLLAIPGEALAPGGVPKGLLREAMRGRMPRSIVERRWKADFTHLVREGLSRYSVAVSGFLRGSPVVAELGLVDGVALRGTLRRWQEGAETLPPGHIWPLLQVLGLELWLRAFVAGEPPSSIPG